jgi:hypothetical protein
MRFNSPVGRLLLRYIHPLGQMVFYAYAVRLAYREESMFLPPHAHIVEIASAINLPVVIPLSLLSFLGSLMSPGVAKVFYFFPGVLAVGLFWCWAGFRVSGSPDKWILLRSVFRNRKFLIGGIGLLSIFLILEIYLWFTMRFLFDNYNHYGFIGWASIGLIILLHRSVIARKSA